jgi:hypothetical protein
MSGAFLAYAGHFGHIPASLDHPPERIVARPRPRGLRRNDPRRWQIDRTIEGHNPAIKHDPLMRRCRLVPAERPPLLKRAYIGLGHTCHCRRHAMPHDAIGWEGVDSSGHGTASQVRNEAI